MNVQIAPVGVFDSGVGGLSVAREIRRALPHVPLLYAADSRFCPYGERTPAEILERSLTMIGALVERGARLLVIACNTATAVALEAARARFAIPIVGLEPAVKPAVALSRSRKVGVIATPRTAASARLASLVERFAGEAQVTTVAAPTWVGLVEAGVTRGPAARAAVAPVVEPLIAAGVDTLVLGCTHYPFLRETIAEVAGPGVRIVDSGEAIARRTATLLGEPEGAGRAAAPFEVLTTGDPAAVRPVAGRLLGGEAAIDVAHLPAAETGYAPALVASPKLSREWTPSTSGRL